MRCRVLTKHTWNIGKRAPYLPAGRREAGLATSPNGEVSSAEDERERTAEGRLFEQFASKKCQRALYPDVQLVRTAVFSLTQALKN